MALHPKKPDPREVSVLRWRRYWFFFAIVSVLALALAAWNDYRLSASAVRVPVVEVDRAAADEAGVAFSGWHWESRFQLHCKMACAKDDFLNYVVRYVSFGPNGQQLAEGHVLYPPMHAGETNTGRIEFEVERGKVDHIKLTLFKTTGQPQSTPDP